MALNIKQRAADIAKKAGDGVAKLSSLSPSQVVELDELRDSYLLDMPQVEDPVATELTSRLLAAAGIEIYDAFLPLLDGLYIPVREEAPDGGKWFSRGYNVRLLNITKWVVDSEESSLEKLINVYGVLASELCNIGLVFHRSRVGVDAYLAVVNTRNSNSNLDVEDFRDRIEAALKGNFPGSECERCLAGETLDGFFSASSSVASVSGVPTEKSKEFRSQTIEKLLDGMVPSKKNEEYTLILLATPALDAEERKMRLEQLYTGLAPYSEWQTNFTYTEQKGLSSSATVGLNAGVSVGKQMGTNQSLADGSAVNDSASVSEQDTQGLTKTDSVSDTITDSRSHTKGSSDSMTGGVNVGGGVELGPFKLDASANASTSHGTSVSDTVSTSRGKTCGRALAESASHAVSNTIGRAVTQSVTRTVGSFASQSLGANFGANFARTSTVSATIGKNEGISQTHVNYTIKHALSVLERQMKRLEEGMSLGLWGFAAYVVSDDFNMANNVAYTYLSLLEGEESFVTQSAVNSWRGDTQNHGAADVICSYLKCLRHPVFALNPTIVAGQLNYLPYPTAATATTALTGKELARALNFPRKPVAGLPVLECAAFGRNVCTFDGVVKEGDSLELGDVFHMHHCEPTRVKLDLDSLAAHTFITGSTGSGKSNAVYLILEEARKKGVNFLVVEPAKGEYKGVFGNDPDVLVFSTNPSFTPLLRLNPFSFPSGIHVLEHVDRLVEIFNACWPMYAAMPAVLKQAIENSYEDCGWDLRTSRNAYDDGFYPTFADIVRNVQAIIETSEYDAESKGAYKGALIMRLSSLTGGINGMVFCEQELSPEELFEGQTIVDLSRVGSTETKSLLMGVLVMKLQEWRMVQPVVADAHLQHITVLEEAHNLLKKTSLEQGAEGVNLQGKSVEMLGNAIAEMRSYGEGFIIADQAPGLLDPAAIRNTNTKIVMRLPDAADRALAGGSEALTEAQIDELARLPLGVAAVYQNDWVEAVLCKIGKASRGFKPYVRREVRADGQARDTASAIDIMQALVAGESTRESLDLAKVRVQIKKSGIPSSLKAQALRILEEPPAEPRIRQLAPIISALFPEAREAAVSSKRCSTEPADWTRAIHAAIDRTNGEPSEYLRLVITQGVLVDYLVGELHDQDSFNEWGAKGAFAG